MSAFSSLSQTLARFANANTALGEPERDSVAGSNINYPAILDRDTLDSAYTQSWAIRRACDWKPKNATTKGGTLKLGGAETNSSEIIETVNKLVLSNNRVAFSDTLNLQIAKYFTLAQIAANRSGGAGLLILFEEDDNLSEPVDLGRIRSISGLRLFNRWQLSPDWGQEYYSGKLEPDYYRLLSSGSLQRVGQPIHRSRILPFLGNPLPEDDTFYLNDGWMGDSIVRQILTELARLDISSASVADKMSRFAVILLKIKNFVNKLAASKLRKTTDCPNIDEATYAEKIKQRASALQKGWSNYRVAIADMDEEDLELVEHKFDGIVPILQFFRDAVTAASGLPEFIMQGKHGSGLGQVEKGERSTVASLIESQQEEWEGNLETLLTYYFLSKKSITGGAIPDYWTWTWNPLWQPTDEEQARTQNLQSQTLARFVDMSVKLQSIGDPTALIISGEEIRRSVFGGADFGGTNIQLNEEIMPEVERLLLEPEEKKEEEEEEEELESQVDAVVFEGNKVIVEGEVLPLSEYEEELHGLGEEETELPTVMAAE